MVDGGYDALVAAGAPIVKGAAAYTPAEVTIEAIDETHLINTDALAADYANYKIVDVRADEEYERPSPLRRGQGRPSAWGHPYPLHRPVQRGLHPQDQRGDHRHV